MYLISKSTQISGVITIPASKSHTIRATALASLAKGSSTIHYPLDSQDALSSLTASEALGCQIKQEDNRWIISGIDALPISNNKTIDIGNSGTSLRIFSAIASLGQGSFTFTGDSSIRTRPMEPLLSALTTLGVKTTSTKGKCPITLKGELQGGTVTVDGTSSQYLTALLISLPFAPNDSTVTVENLNEKPYIDITLKWLEKTGIIVTHDNYTTFHITGNQKIKSFEETIPADFSSSLFSLTAAILNGNNVTLKGLDFNDKQGDKEIFNQLQQMGANITINDTSVLINKSNLKGITLDINATPDALPILAVIATAAEGETHLTNVYQARLKECDRITAIATELKKMGANIEEKRDGLIIRQSELTGCRLHGYDDHRMVMALAVAGMIADGETIIDNAESIDVTYPSFVKDMNSLGASFTIVDNIK